MHEEICFVILSTVRISPANLKEELFTRPSTGIYVPTAQCIEEKLTIFTKIGELQALMRSDENYHHGKPKC